MSKQTALRALRQLAPWLLAAACGLSLAQTAGTESTPITSASRQTLDDQFEQALLAYERNHWPQAFDAFTLLAEQGHADAARMVMQMHRLGPRLYGQDFVLTPLQLQRFAQHRLRTQALAADARAR